MRVEATLEFLGEVRLFHPADPPPAEGAALEPASRVLFIDGVKVGEHAILEHVGATDERIAGDPAPVGRTIYETRVRVVLTLPTEGHR